MNELDDGMPEAFTKADGASNAAQRTFTRWTRWLLLLSLAGAVAGVVTVWEDYRHEAALLGTGFFALGALLAGRLAVEKPNRRWYDARAAAESAKTLAIQYAVAGGAYPLSSQSADSDCRAAIESIPAALPNLPSLGPLNDPVTPQMRAIRMRSLNERREVYVRDRVDDQRTWYEKSAKTNEESAQRWRSITFGGQCLGIIGGLLYGIGVWEVGLLGVAAAVTASAAAWMRTKDFDGLAEAYKVTARELARVKNDGTAVEAEDEWAPYVADAESAVSREHTLWLARRG